ncbi:MAG: divalent metal cation transporter [Planctomycetota bacterium]
MEPKSSAWRAIGPGVLYAGAAIGVSHLVQSTRAGALYGLSLVAVVVLAHVFKYPAMRVGPQYAAATGASLVVGYRRRGRWALALFAILTLGTMFIIQAAVTFITASLVRLGAGSLGLPTNTWWMSTWFVALGLLTLCAGLLAIGGYRWLDRCLKALMVAMVVVTLLAAATQVPVLFNEGVPILPDLSAWGVAEIAFVAVLVGWMPAPLDIAAWQSIWSLERDLVIRRRCSRRESRLDFHVGYALCVVTALAFLVLGAGVMHTRGVTPANGSIGFVAQIVSLYTDAIGEWVRPIVLLGALAIMLSTTITVLDAIPRTLVAIGHAARATEPPPRSRLKYWIALVVLGAGAQGVICYTLFRDAGAWRWLIDLATTLAFLSTPLLAWLNHLAWTGREVPPEHRPGTSMRVFSWVCIGVWLVFAGVWVVYAWPWSGGTT